MTEETLRELIAGGETATVEFKSSATRPIEVAVRMCGMANNRAGGIIIFGIEDATRAIVGIRNPSLTNDVVLRAARMIKPAVPLSETSVQTWTLDGCTLVTVENPTEQWAPLSIRRRLLRSAWNEHSTAVGRGD
jgi:predicted HTH transcriptional regulator